MNWLVQKSVVAAGCLGLVLFSTGCMTTPGHGENIGNVEGDVKFRGYGTSPNTWVKIQAKHPSVDWQTIGWAKTKIWSVPYSGSDWYPWNGTKSIPWAYWTYLGSGDPNGHFSTEVRAVEYPSNNVLGAFEAGYTDWFDYNTSLGTMWSEHGAGASAKIYGNLFLE